MNNQVEFDARRKIRERIEELWPAVYQTVNDFLFAILSFVKDTIRGLWPR